MVRKGRTWRKRYSTKENSYQNLALDEEIIQLSKWMKSKGFENKLLVPAIFKSNVKKRKKNILSLFFFHKSCLKTIILCKFTFLQLLVEELWPKKILLILLFKYQKN